MTDDTISNMLSYYKTHHLGACAMVAERACTDIKQLAAALDESRGTSNLLADQSARLREELKLAMGGMAAQDRREAAAGEKCGVHAYEHACDWPDGVADVVLDLRAVVANRGAVLAKIQLYADECFKTAIDKHARFCLWTVCNMVKQCIDSERTQAEKEAS